MKFIPIEIILNDLVIVEKKYFCLSKNRKINNYTCSIY